MGSAVCSTQQGAMSSLSWLSVPACTSCTSCAVIPLIRNIHTHRYKLVPLVPKSAACDLGHGARPHTRVLSPGGERVLGVSNSLSIIKAFDAGLHTAFCVQASLEIIQVASKAMPTQVCLCLLYQDTSFPCLSSAACFGMVR